MIWHQNTFVTTRIGSRPDPVPDQRVKAQTIDDLCKMQEDETVFQYWTSFEDNIFYDFMFKITSTI